MRKISNKSSSSVREIKLFLCGEGTTDFGSERDPDGPLQVVLVRTLLLRNSPFRTYRCPCTANM